MTHRVVVTGMSGITAFGTSWDEIQPRLESKTNAVRTMNEWNISTDLRTKLAAPVENYVFEKFPRKKIRSMGRVSLLATCATKAALNQAGLIDDEALVDGSTGVAYGSSSGSSLVISVSTSIARGEESRRIVKNAAASLVSAICSLMSCTRCASPFTSAIGASS